METSKRAHFPFSPVIPAVVMSLLGIFHSYPNLRTADHIKLSASGFILGAVFTFLILDRTGRLVPFWQKPKPPRD